jgi:hypothetical protein
MAGESKERARVVLICHDEEPLNREGLARWLASFTDLVGIVVLRETRGRARQRVRREIRRVGMWRFLDVLLFRLHYKITRQKRDRAWEGEQLAELCAQFAPLNGQTAILDAASPNTPAVEAFLKECRPNLLIARCKTLLKPNIYSIPARGSFVMHPGICPQYRNAHGCFWALARNDPENVGMTLLQIDEGVDTGAVYGYFRCDLDGRDESHIVLQHRTVFDNLDAIRAKLLEIHAGTAKQIDTTGRPSTAWGQPWFSAYRASRKLAMARRSHANQPSLS